MKWFSSFTVLGAFAATVSSTPITRRDVDEALIPQFGFSSGVNPTGTGDCDGAVKGANGQPIKVPCSCPPDRSTFVQTLDANVAAGHILNNPSVPIAFPQDDSKESQLARLNAASVTLQNLNGPGKGCPIVSTTFQAQAAAINAGTPPVKPPPASTPASSSSTPSPVTPSASQIEALAPSLGFTAGKNPTGTGDCDGAVNGADGKPIKIPCSCPPDQGTFNQHLVADVFATHAVNNPSVQVSFPLDDSKASQLARINAASVTLQNLFGPGKGCPVVSTTFQAQAAAINAGTAPPPPAVPSASPPPAPSSAPASSPSPSPSPTLSAAPPPASPDTPSAAQIEALAPQLGFSAGKNPTGTGDCDGAVNGANGQPIKVPCSCPPDQTTFNQHLVGDVTAGQAVNNPSVKVSFPLDNSVQSQLARVDTALVTLQNLFGPGKGCPAVSTTLSAQQAALLKQL